MRVENAVLIRMLLLGAAAVAIGRYLFMDYSNVFPSSLAMRVFYGEKGIAESLKAVPAPLRASLPVPSDDPQSYRERFLKDLDREIETAIGAVGFFSKPDSVQGYGEVKNLIQKRSG